MLADAALPLEVNVTVMVQVFDGASELEAAGQLLVSEKLLVFVPVTAMPLMTSGVVPVLVRVKGRDALLLLLTVPKLRPAVGVRLAVE